MKKLVYFAVALVVITTAFTSCNNDNEGLRVLISKSVLRCGKDTTKCYVFTTSTRYEVYTPDSLWCHLHTSRISREDSFECYIDENTTGAERTANIIFRNLNGSLSVVRDITQLGQ